MTQFDSYTCEKCHRSYLVVRDTRSNTRAEAEHPCNCGGELRTAALAPGMYEVLPRTAESQRSAPEPVRDSPAVSRPAEPAEADLGYGKSHGYAAGHGGPSGPGDAPASEPSPSRSKDK
jgi:hypothetical protein